MTDESRDDRPTEYDFLHRQLIQEEAICRTSSELILSELLRYVAPKSVLDVGCGIGTWLAMAQQLGATDVLGIEGIWLDKRLARIPANLIVSHDLERPFNLRRRFDLVICLEVAEHLPASSAAPFVESLAAHSDVILFSAAIPFQGGTHHVNEQFPNYWSHLFSTVGYRPVDCIRSAIWSNPAVLWWLRQNTLVFAKEELLRESGPFGKLSQRAGPLSIVHPELYLMRSKFALALEEQKKLMAPAVSGETVSVVRQSPGASKARGNTTEAAQLAQAEQLLRAGRLDEMERLCRLLLETAPDDICADAHRFLGLSAFLRNQLSQAEAHVRRALASAPDSAAAHDNLSLYLLGLGRPIEAEASARQALALQPTLAAAAHNLGLALRRQGRHAEAESALRQALVLEPRDADAWNNLATVMEQRGRPSEAVVALEIALQSRPDFPLAQANLQRLRGVPMPTIKPRGSSAEIENNRGVELLAQRRFAEAEQAFRQALLLAPQMPEISFNLAKALQSQDQLPQAEECFLFAARLRPDWADLHFHLGYLYFCQRRLGDAEAEYRRAVELAPTHIEALNSLGANVLNNQGRIDEARAAYQQALALAPNHASLHSNLVLNEQYAPGATLAGLADTHARWERQHAAPLYSTHSEAHARSRDAGRPLRLGFVSGDFFYHPVGVFLAPILERLDRGQCWTVCYANQHKNDDLTRRLTQASSQWRWVHDLNDEALAELIRSDGIDLLFDLSGHTGRNRLLTFARRPAPVQLTWMGYVGTTGLSAIDYLIADRFHIPSGWEQHYREQILRLPDGYICYEPPSYAPAVGPLPALATGQVTFGSFNNTAKITPTVVAVWGEILRQVPGSRLILKYHWLDDAGLRHRLRNLFEAEGIAAERLELAGSTSHLQQLEQYNRVDLALDTFPYSGGLTTCEACWMGVPVVTCPGETFASRHSLSYLSNIGLTDTLANDRAEYVAKAVHLTRDLPSLADLRAALRQQMGQSPVCNLDLYTKQFTAALRQVWHAQK